VPTENRVSFAYTVLRVACVAMVAALALVLGCRDPAWPGFVIDNTTDLEVGLYVFMIRGTVDGVATPEGGGFVGRNPEKKIAPKERLRFAPSYVPATGGMSEKRIVVSALTADKRLLFQRIATWEEWEEMDWTVVVRDEP